MKKHKIKLLCFALFSLVSFSTYAQNSASFYGMVRKNFYSTVVSPFDSTLTFQHFDSATIRLGFINTSTGYVSNSGSYSYNQAINLTGSALNPHDRTYVFIGGNMLTSLKLSTGNIVYQTPLSNPIAASYFDNFRFNTSDSTLYGLARRNIFDSVTMTNTGELYLAKVNTISGVITQISPASVGSGYAYSGSAIDPYQMVYYFSTGSHLIGLDLYTGLIYYNTPMVLPANCYFDNFSFSCADSTLYGLVRENYYSYEPIPVFPFDSIQVLDSVGIKLGKINPQTGIVSALSASSVTHGGFSINTGSAIDPNAGVYYYSNGSSLLGLSLQSGQIVSSQTFTFEDGTYFDLMRNFENCSNAAATRLNPLITKVAELATQSEVSIYPNPFTSKIQLKNASHTVNCSLLNSMGQSIYTGNAIEKQNFSSLPNGLYLLKLENQLYKLIKE